MADEEKTTLQKMMPLTTVLLIIVFLYAAWTVYSRWREGKEAQRAAAEREVENAKKVIDMNGGAALKITVLYANPGAVAKGESSQLCYGVVNAKTVKFDPPVEGVWPSMNRCVDVKPEKTTTYTMTADDGAGHTENGTVEIQVK